jgi:hypothetical protein
MAGNPDICAPGDVPAGTLAITEDATFNAARLGVAGAIEPFSGLTLSVDAAYLPYVKLDGSDTHWLRADLDPIPEDGHGTGYQLEAIASYAVTRDLSIGAGGRYWHMETEGDANFFGLWNQPVHFETDRYGAFLQSSYRLWTY